MAVNPMLYQGVPTTAAQAQQGWKGLGAGFKGQSNALRFLQFNAFAPAVNEMQQLPYLSEVYGNELRRLLNLSAPANRLALRDAVARKGEAESRVSNNRLAAENPNLGPGADIEADNTGNDIRTRGYQEEANPMFQMDLGRSTMGLAREGAMGGPGMTSFLNLGTQASGAMSQVPQRAPGGVGAILGQAAGQFLGGPAGAKLADRWF